MLNLGALSALTIPPSKMKRIAEMEAAKFSFQTGADANICISNSST
jgi:hypothetical protein